MNAMSVILVTEVKYASDQPKDLYRFVQNSCDKLKLEQGIEIILFLKDSVFKTVFTGNAW